MSDVDFSLEEWRDIVGYEGLYRVSNFGRILSIERRVRFRNSTRIIRERFLSLNLNTNGYYIVGLTDFNGVNKTIYVHQIVAIAFINCDYKKFKLVVNHKDGNKTNNKVDNLEVVTNSANIKHAITNGLNVRGIGENSPNVKLKNEQVLEIKEALKNPYHGINNYLARKYNISCVIISQIRRGHIWNYDV